MSNSNKYQKQDPHNLNFAILGAIASLAMTLSAVGIWEALQPAQAFENTSVITKQKQTEVKVVKIAGTYKTVFTPEFLVNAKKQGLASISGLWTIKPNGSFEAVIDATSTSGKKQTFRTTGKVLIKNGKVLSQVETLNGKRPAQLPPTQSYTLLADGKTLQADNQPVKLVKQ
ncbi:MAG: hypothetical protein ACK6CP_07800 [Pseudanabaena sp.]|jgi:hypothetical protein|nr:hypothetical protein [Pseudanabaena sp. M090S1SP2A07QC]MCA6506679.1 hypothetical protein [Pseudanabaena sp. M172S2SP2A07QC]MCA6519086.1 hypothetical protein [Pseudanabaena sp. M110S1SP2A07QC]MCA6522863.1 hypothetical protein [Pseudanabaena sp. M051S1SP2A07QC]MCA6526994.1 hypothetical protein [Pseudanabaena sp. M179S2SP2A07QC]MCA6529667.1 hypothetical protein [Pseudanabaena sp. M125S2SP2A07QC]MCA6535934.1 hypothetical protein [Pseudanabaena sp. M176S2SP2A07QC]MCA6540928.1 hypothetical prot